MPQKIAVFGDLPQEVQRSIAARDRVDSIRRCIGGKLLSIITRHVPKQALTDHDLASEFDFIPCGFEGLTRADVLGALQKHKPVGALTRYLRDIRDPSVGTTAQEAGVSAWSTFSVGTDHLDVAQLTRLNIPVFHTPDVLTDAVAVHALSLIMALANNIFKADALVRDARWRAEDTLAIDANLCMPDLFTWTVGIVGMGRIGTEVLHHLAAFGTNVVWTDTDPAIESRAAAVEQHYGDLARQRGHEPTVQFVSLDELLERSDLVSVHTDLNDTSSNLFNARNFSKMKKGAFFVNTARAGVADYGALYEQLESNRLGGAGLDVFEREPIPPDDLKRLAALPNVILTPHMASNRAQTRLSMWFLSCYALMAWLLGYRPTNIANPQVYG